MAIILGGLFLVDQWIRYGQVFGGGHGTLANLTLRNATSTEFPINASGDGTVFV